MAQACVSLIPGVSELLADKGYDTDAFRSYLKDKGIKPVIPGKSNRKTRIRYDKEAYKGRNVVEIDQSWRLSRLSCGRWGRRGALRWPPPPRHRGCEDRFQSRDFSRIGVDKFDMRCTDLDKAAA